MRRRRDECYVLDTFALGEADRIVTLLAREHGKVRAVARSARSSRRRFGGALQPLTRLDAEWVEREGRELHRLDAVDSVRSFAEMQSEPELQATCAVLAEIARTFAHEGQAEAAAFRLLGAVLEALEAGGDPASLLRYFEYWTLRLQGLLPEADGCALCSRPLPPGGGVRVVAGRGLCCGRCRPEAGERERAWTGRDRRTLGLLAARAPAELPRLDRAGRGSALELFLRGALEAFAERGFRAYRHLEAPPVRRSGGAG